MPPVVRTRLRPVLVLILAAGVLAGCGSQTDRPASARAEDFYSAIAHHDAAGACADLAPKARQALEQQEKKQCADTILDQDLPSVHGSGRTRVYGSMAQVVHGDEVAFLSRYDNRWLVTGVGCTKVAHDEPYDCAIEVG